MYKNIHKRNYTAKRERRRERERERNEEKVLYLKLTFNS
jgi:hypothetical protein